MQTSPIPVPLNQRIQLLDMLRGLAIFGILMVNMQLFYQPLTTMMTNTPAEGGISGQFSEMFIKFFFEGKFYIMFSLLFGYGFYVFMNKSTQEGESIIPLFRKRVFFLLIFGMLHVAFIWAGDILVYYALFGFILILFRKVSNRGLIKWAVWLALIPTLLVSIFALFIGMAMQSPEVGDQMVAGMNESSVVMQQKVADAAAVYATGSYMEILNVRLWEYSMLLPGIVFFYPMVMAMFLIGFWAGRKGLLKNYKDYLPFFRKVALWGFILGVPLSLVYIYTYANMQRQMPDLYSVFNTIGSTLGGFLLSLFYISSLVLLTAANKTQTLQRLLSPVGRMALTNYLLQSLICTTIFYSYGFGMFGTITPLEGILLTVLIFSLQIPLSIVWLKHFNYGPMEWLWRSLTYGKFQAFRKQQPETKTAYL